MTDTDIDNLTHDGNAFLLTYSALAQHNLDKHICLYAMKPKFHQLDHHLSDLKSDRLNPGIYWNYGDEDMVGRIKAIARKAYRGHTAFGRAVIRRYLLQVSLRWKRVGTYDSMPVRRVRQWRARTTAR